MVALLSVLVLIALFLTVARVATVVLEITGMARPTAEFQARSALLGVGFTSRETEEVMHHPIRRRIVLWLMTFGNAGAITGVASFIIAFGDEPVLHALQRSGALAAGIGLLLVSVHLSAANRLIAAATRSAVRRFTHMEVSSATTLVRLDQHYSVVEIRVARGDSLAGQSLQDLKGQHLDLQVLGIRRHDGSFVGSPSEATVIRHGDVVTAYGRSGQLSSVARPRASRSRPAVLRPARH